MVPLRKSHANTMNQCMNQPYKNLQKMQGKQLTATVLSCCLRERRKQPFNHTRLPSNRFQCPSNRCYRPAAIGHCPNATACMVTHFGIRGLALDIVLALHFHLHLRLFIAVAVGCVGMSGLQGTYSPGATATPPLLPSLMNGLTPRPVELPELPEPPELNGSRGSTPRLADVFAASQDFEAGNLVLTDVPSVVFPLAPCLTALHAQLDRVAALCEVRSSPPLKASDGHRLDICSNIKGQLSQ